MMNELRQLLNQKYKSNPYPLKLTIATTFKCNSKCNICGIWKIYNNKPSEIKSELKINDYKRLFKELNDKLLWLEFTGGEPFLREDFIEVIKNCYIYLPSLLSIGITTNGLNSDKVIQDTNKILANKPNDTNITIGVSLDGNNNIYKDIRGIDGYKKALSTYLELRKMKRKYNNFNPHIAYTISSINAGKFKKFYIDIRDKYDIEINEFSFAVEHNSKYYNLKNNKNNKSNVSNLINDIDYILEIKNNYNNLHNIYQNGLITSLKNRFYYQYLKKAKDYLTEPSNVIIPCTAGKASAYIDPYGNVYACTMWDNKLGNITNQKFSTIWTGKTRKKIRKKIKNKKCPNCWTPCEAQPSWVSNLPWSLLK